jgi:hypothetical protein
MTKSRAIFKTAAVLNAALLFGGYVWYRGGSTYADGPEPVQPVEKEESPPVDATEEKARAMLSGSKSEMPFKVRQAPAKPAEGRVMMGGSKSRRVIDDPPVTEELLQVIMSGSKSEKVAAPHAEQKPRAMMPGSKVMVLDDVRFVPTEAEVEVLREALDDTKAAKTATEALAPIQREKRVIMSGSKSAVAFPEQSRPREVKPAQEEKPVPVEPLPADTQWPTQKRQVQAPAQQQNRAMMSGSKSERALTKEELEEIYRVIRETEKKK